MNRFLVSTLFISAALSAWGVHAASSVRDTSDEGTKAAPAAASSSARASRDAVVSLPVLALPDERSAHRDAVYFVSGDNVLHAIRTGPAGGGWPVGWHPVSLGVAASQPVVVEASVRGASRVVLTSARDGRVFAVDGGTGDILWVARDLGAATLSAPMPTSSLLGEPPDLALVAVRTAKGGVAIAALELSDGSVAWESEVVRGASGLDGLADDRLTVDPVNKRLFVAVQPEDRSEGGRVECLAFTSSGATRIWSRDLGVGGTHMVLSRGRLYAATGDGRLFAIDPGTGGDLWGGAGFYTCPGGAVTSALVFDPRSRLLCFSTAQSLWAISDTGVEPTLAWRNDGIQTPSAPTIAPRGGYLLVGSGDGRLYQLDIATGLPSGTTLAVGDGTSALGLPMLDEATAMAYVPNTAGQIFGIQVPLQ